MGSLATTQNSTFISLTSNVISDAATIQLTPIPDSLAFRVSEYTADSSRPALARFTFDLDEGCLILEFSETVDVSTIQLSQFLLQSIPFTTSVDVRLTTISLSGGNTASLDILIERAYLNEIKRLPVCTSNSDCYLSFPETVLNDTNGNRVVEKIPVEVECNISAVKLATSTASVQIISFLFLTLMKASSPKASLNR